MYMCEWWLYAFTDNTWSFEIGSKSFVIACLSGYILSISSKIPLLSRSAIAVITLTAWCDFIEFIAWNASGMAVDVSAISGMLFFIWLFYEIKRNYPERIDIVNLSNVNILILKPRTTWDVYKSLIGVPAASICIIADSKIWAFRSKTGIFESSEYNHSWVNSHLVIDTRIKTNLAILVELNKVAGVKRSPCIKCVWAIRKALNSLGGKYRIRSWLDYIPGLYLIRLLNG